MLVTFEKVQTISWKWNFIPAKLHKICEIYDVSALAECNGKLLSVAQRVNRGGGTWGNW